MTVTERPAAVDHKNAVRQLLVSAIPLRVGVLTWGEAQSYPGKLPPTYVLMQVSRRYRPNARLDAMDPAESRRVNLRWVGDTEANASRVGDLCNAAIEHASLTVGDRQTTRIQFETGEAVQPDDGMFSGSADYTYTL